MNPTQIELLDEGEVKERPILFSGKMVRAILEERKTCTRRVMNPQPVDAGSGDWWYPGPALNWQNAKHYANEAHMQRGLPTDFHPYGQPGDRLWVRETFAVQPDLWAASHVPQPIHFLADCKPEQIEDYILKPSIHMPRWASRITLEITGVRVERVQDISEEDATAEGMEFISINTATWSNRQSFKVLWDSINAKRGFTWESNPWVWIIEFKRTT